MAVPVAPQPGGELERIEIELLLEAIDRHYGFDFRGYALGSLRRRLWRAASEEGVKSISGLQEKVLHDPEAMERLLAAALGERHDDVPRPEFYAAFREHVVPLLRTYPFIRVWNAGCSTGEETYSLAILLEEEGLYERSRIYATDFNADVLSRAQAGEFPLDRMQEYTQNYQRAGGTSDFSAYYSVEGGFAKLDERLSEHVVFAQHNLASDRSFNEFNVVLCRNVLIYFGRDLQRRVHRLFYDSLARFGVLGLGQKETLRFTDLEDRYEELDPRREALPEGRLMPFELIAMGASWGGMRALAPMLEPLPEDFEIPVVIAQHRPGAGRDELLEQVLGAQHEARGRRRQRQGARCNPGRVYVAPADYHLIVEPGHLALSTDDYVQFSRPSIDVLFESAADAYGERAVGVLLTGVNEDGADGPRRG